MSKLRPKQMGLWISVKERLPDKGCEVLGYILFTGHTSPSMVTLVYCRDVEGWIPNCECGGWECSRQEFTITHWMPLPSPPQQP